jgi:hypothetical protein
MHILILTSQLTSRLRDLLEKHLLVDKHQRTSFNYQHGGSSHQSTSGCFKEPPLASLDAFKKCFIQLRNSVSPLDKLAHLLTALKVLLTSVSKQT